MFFFRWWKGISKLRLRVLIFGVCGFRIGWGLLEFCLVKECFGIGNGMLWGI